LHHVQFVARLLDLFLGALYRDELLFLGEPERDQLVRAWLEFGNLQLDLFQPLLGRRVRFLLERSRSIFSWMIRRSISSIASGFQSASIRSRLAASSMRSMA
jgi:hypothetical protein